MWCGYERGLGHTEVDGFQCRVPDILERSGLEFTEADGFFRLTVEGKEFDLVAPRFSPRPAQEVMSADEYAFLLRSHGVSHDWQFREKPANRRAWRLADEDLKHEWRQISGAASQRLGQSSSLAALVAAVRSLGGLTFAQRAWLQAPEAPPLECWPVASPSGSFSFMPSVERVECRLEVLLLAALKANEFVPHASDFFPVAEFKCKVLQWQAQCAKVRNRERELVHSVASALIAFLHAPRALCSRLLPGEVVHHLYAPKDLIRFTPRPADWDALWQACFRAGNTRFKQPFCEEFWGVWMLARRALQKGLAERQFLPDQVAELLAHDPWQAQQAGSGAPHPTKDPEQACVQEVHRHLRSVGLQEAGVSAATMFVPRQRPALQRSHAIRRFLETMPPEGRPYLPQKRTAKKKAGVRMKHA